MNASFRRFFPSLVSAFAPIRRSAVNPTTRLPSSDSTITLSRRAMLRVPHPLDRRITCESGAIWITVDYDRKDFVLEAGQSFTALKDRLVIIQALEPAAIHVA